MEILFNCRYRLKSHVTFSLSLYTTCLLSFHLRNVFLDYEDKRERNEFMMHILHLVIDYDVVFENCHSRLIHEVCNTFINVFYSTYGGLVS